jgi:copper chaperone CopZ
MRYVYRLEGLCCAVCADKIETAVNKIDGVTSARIVFMTQRLTVETDVPDILIIEQKIEKIVKKIEPDVRLRKV